jgi:dipeptidyl aminopeptidase/acylaminoacyl peptidase
MTRINLELSDRLRQGAFKRMSYKSFDALKVEAFLVYPPDYRKGKRYPLIVAVHGGPNSHFPIGPFPLGMQARAAAGYIVMLPNPRGSTSYGDKFTQACVGDWGGGDFKDIMAGVDRLIERGEVHPDKLYIEGYSYGGFMSSWAIGQTNRFKGAAIGAPLTDLTSAYATSDINHYLGQQVTGDPYRNEDAFKLHSPMSYIKKVRTPAMITHWEGDTRCPIGQSEQFYFGLKTLNRKTQFIRYPGGSHGVRSPSQSEDYLVRTLNWFAEHK